MSSESNNKKKTGTKKGSGNKSSVPEKDEPVSVLREPKLGMNPVAILTGYYGSRGERIRHTVHDGALRMPKEALDLIEEVTSETGVSASKTYELPGLDSVVRPSIDPNVETIVVTDLFLEKVAVQQPVQQSEENMGPPPEPAVVHVIRTRAQNRTITRTLLNSDNNANSTERIRGGGADDDNKMDVDSKSPSQAKPAAAGSSTASTAAPVATQIPTAPQAAAPPTAPVATPVVLPATAPAPPALTPIVPPAAVLASGVQAPLQPVVPANPGQPSPASVVVSSTSAPIQNSASMASPFQTQASGQAATVSASAVTSGSDAKPQSTPSAVPSSAVSTPAPLSTLSKTPAPQWEQHKPGPNDEMVTPADQLTPMPDWYKKDDVANIERTMLPEWFDSSAPHRTFSSYIKAREKAIEISGTIANRNVTNAMMRRSIVGDAGSLQRLRNFLVNFGLINEDGINDSAPTPAVLKEQGTSSPKRFNDQLRDELVGAVLQQSKKQKIGESSFVPIDWEKVAMQVGHGATSEDCERNFLSVPLNNDNVMSTERSITPDNSHDKESKEASPESRQSKDISRQEVIRDLIDSSSPEIIRKVTEAAMEAAENNLKKAQSSAVLGLVASRAIEEARLHENALSSVLSQLVNQRMEKLENRMALLDDIEGIMEAEKVALELERRDLYTARCRHWFGGS